MPTTRRLSASLLVMLGVIITTIAFAMPANAATGPYVTAPATTVSDQTPAAGSSFQFCGSGYQPDETVTIALDDGTTFPSVTAGSSGEFCATIVLGATLTGTHTITATGSASGRTSNSTIQVAGVSVSSGDSGTGNTGNSGQLAFTGAAVVGIGAVGALLLVGGGLLVFAGRRRKVNASDL